jgi:hypothetical protein
MARFQILLPVFIGLLAFGAQAATWDRAPGVAGPHICDTLSPTRGQCTYDFTDSTEPEYHLRLTNQCKPFVWVDPDITGPQDLARIDVARCTSKDQAYGLCTEVDSASKFTRGAALGTFLGINIETPPSGVTARVFAFCEDTTSVVGTPSRCARFDAQGLLVPATGDCPAGAGAATIQVEDIDQIPQYTGVGILQFDQADGFVITEPSAGTVRIDFTGGGGINHKVDGGANLDQLDFLNANSVGITIAEVDGGGAGGLDGIEFDLDLTEIDGATWGTNTVDTFDITFDLLSDDLILTVNTTGLAFSHSITILDQSQLQFVEASPGVNFLALKPPANVTSNQLCTLEDDASFIPDSCVGDGVDGGGGDDITVQSPFGDPVDPIFNDTATIAVTATDSTPDYIEWDVVADSLDETQLGSGIEFASGDNITFAEIATPGNAPAGTVRIYAKNTGEICSIDDGGFGESCMSDGAGGTPDWDDITVPSENQTLAMDLDTTIFTWSDTADTAIDAFTLVFDQTSATSTSAQTLLTLQLSSTSTNTIDALLDLENADTGSAIGAAIQAVNAGGGFQRFIDTSALAAASPVLTVNGPTDLSGTELALLDGGLILASADFVDQGTTSTFLKGNAAGNPSFDAISLNTTEVDGTLPVERGGTEATTFTDGGVLVGAAAGPIEALAVGTDGQLLIGDTAANPVWFTVVEANWRSLDVTLGGGTFEIDADEELYRHTETIVVEEPELTDDFLFLKADGALYLQELNCVARGTPTPSAFIVAIWECTLGGASCTDSNLRVTVNANTTNYPDTVASDPNVGDNQWLEFRVESFTVAPDWIHCTVMFTKND